jgi:hypothetical protein
MKMQYLEFAFSPCVENAPKSRLGKGKRGRRYFAKGGYATRFWAIYLNDEMLAITLHSKRRNRHRPEAGRLRAHPIKGLSLYLVAAITGRRSSTCSFTRRPMIAATAQTKAKRAMLMPCGGAAGEAHQNHQASQLWAPE